MLNRLRRLTEQWHPLAKQLRSDPTYRLQTFQDVQRAADLGFTLDVNQATIDDWLKLPGISIRQAQTLAQLRRAGVQFYCVEDLAAALGVPLKQLQPLMGVLQFCHYEDSLQPLSLNQASFEQLSRIPGMTSQLAWVIVGDRAHRGPYQTLADLHTRLGLSPEQIQALMYYLRP